MHYVVWRIEKSCYVHVINPMTIFLAMAWCSYSDKLEIIAIILAIASCLLQLSAIYTRY